jgi:adenosylcobinamide-GDP ribazoletransferase
MFSLFVKVFKMSDRPKNFPSNCAEKIADTQEREGLINSLLGAIIFYTTIPLPMMANLNLERIARWAPAIGLFLGGLLAILDWALQQVNMPVLTRSALVVMSWLFLTGGLHFDGAMDTADGLAVVDRDRRLEVMQDSVTGAFGVMAAIALLFLKTAALSEIHSDRALVLMGAAGWGRWAQVGAIAFYPYLRETGKGAFHKQTLRLPQDLLLGLLGLLLLAALPCSIDFHLWKLTLAMTLAGCAIALSSGYWFYRRLQGHTGDTYGAVVEWTEALLLCFLVGFIER